MTGLCKDCKHWERLREASGHFCNLTLSYNNKRGERSAITGAIAQVKTHDVSAYLRTDPTFGCVQFESKE